MTIHNQPYEPICTYESHGQLSLGYRIEVSMPKTLTDEDNHALYAVQEALQKLIFTSLYRDDPKEIEDHQVLTKDIRALFGDRLIFMEEIPNGYSSDPCYIHTPWHMVTTPIGHFKLGWRKRVINIDWTRTTVKTHGEELFPDQDVTRSGKYDKERYIHAYGYEKAKEYIDTIFKAAQDENSPSPRPV